MKEGAGQALDRQRWLTALAAVCLVVLAALALLCLAQSRMLQLRVDHAYAGEQAGRALSAALQRNAGVRGLRPVVDTLLRRRDLGLTMLVVRDTEGVVLSRAGRFEWLRLPLLPAAIQERLRAGLYGLTGSGGEARIVGADGRLLGSVEYNLAPGIVEEVQIEAVAALRLAGWIAAGLALPVAAMVVIGLRRERRRRPAWLMRADPSQTGAAGDWGSEDLDEFRDRAGQVMDALDYAMIVTDREGTVRYLNRTAERLCGWSAADARGRMVYSIFHVVDADGGPLKGPAELALEQNRDQPAHTGRLRSRSGEILSVEMMASCVRARKGGQDGVSLLFRDASVHQRELESLRREARLSQAVVDHLDEGLLTTDMAGVVRSANARAERMFGYSRDELVGFTVTKLMPVPFLNTPSVRITDYVSGRGGKLPKVVGWRKDATTFPVDLWVQTLRADGTDGLVVIVRDISERLRGENLATRLGRLLDSASEEVYIFDAQSLFFLEVNRGARRNLGYSAEALVRMTALDISEELTDESYRNFLAQLRGGERDHLVYRCRHKRADGSSYPVEVRLNFSREEEPPVFMAIASDITDRLLAEDKLMELAHFDALTGLPNRVMLHDRLQQALLAAQRGPRLLGVLFLDLDRFKQINDRYGHEVGDQVLKAVADRLRSTMRPTDTVARLSGDEFVILAPGLRSAQDAEFLAEKLLERFAQPLDVPGLSLTSAPSIGITLYPLDDSDAEGLLRHADSAMYQAKQAGRGCYRLFTTEIDPERRRQFDLEREIHAAVALNQFELSLAPAHDGAGQPRAMLAGLRWLHPRYDVVGEDEIWQAAGRAGLLADVELWQICQACEQLHAAGQPGGGDVLPYVVPVSGWQLRDREFVAHVAGLLDRYGVPAERLVLALTPDGLVDAADRHADAATFAQLGVRFALRDFNVPPQDVGLPLAYVLVGRELLADKAAVRRLHEAMPAGVEIIAVNAGEAAAAAPVSSGR